MDPKDKAAEALRLAHLLDGRYALSHEDYMASAALLREYAAQLQAQPAEAGRVPLTDADGRVVNKLIKIGGKSYRCSCGCNVFHPPDKDDLNLFECNSCGTHFQGE